MKHYIAVARVSSREQEREGFSLEVQLDGFRQYIKKHKGVLERVFSIAETATKSEERAVFREVIAYAKRHSKDLDGILFYKIDRAVRNLRDLLLLEELESKYGIDFISITQPIENTPTGRMMRRQLATFAAFTTDQQSVDVQEGIRKRVESGLFPSRAPYGYRNVRRSGRGLVETHRENSRKVRRIFDLFAYHGMSVEEIVRTLADEGETFTPSKPKFSVSKIYAILNDRSYLGEVKFHGDWLPGVHEPLIDTQTWDQVQVILGKRIHRSHDILLAGELVVCGFCGRPVTGECKTKLTKKKGERVYVYYRCSRYRAKGHPQIRLREQDLEPQVLKIFNELDDHSAAIEDWLVSAFQNRVGHHQQAAAAKIKELKRQLSRIAKQQQELLNLRIASEVSSEEFEIKRAELRDRERILMLQMKACEDERRQGMESSVRAAEVFGLICEMWPEAGNPVKRRILKIVFVNFTLDGDKLVPCKRTPFELLSAA